MGNKLFEQHQAAEQKAQRTTADYERGIRQTGKAKEPDDKGNAKEQNARIRRAVKKGIV